MRGRIPKIPVYVVTPHSQKCFPKDRQPFTIDPTLACRTISWSKLHKTPLTTDTYKTAPHDNFLILHCPNPCCEATYALPMKFVEAQLFLDRISAIPNPKETELT